MSNPNNPRLTLDDIMAYKPCHALATIAGWMGNRKSVSLLTALRHPDVSDADKVWLACYAITPNLRRKFVDFVVDEQAIPAALSVYSEPSFVAWANGWLKGTDRSAAAAYAAATAAAAAAYAAYAASAYAAYAAATAAAASAYAAYAVAAEATATATAAAAATYAAFAAADYAAARAAQVQWLMEAVK